MTLFISKYYTQKSLINYRRSDTNLSHVHSPKQLAYNFTEADLQVEIKPWILTLFFQEAE